MLYNNSWCTTEGHHYPTDTLPVSCWMGDRWDARLTPYYHHLHIAQFHQSREVKKSTEKTVSKIHSYILGAPCYALYHGPRRNRQPRWVPAIVTKIYGTRSLNVKVVPKAPTERRHVEQLRPRFSTEKDKDPGDKPYIREGTKPQTQHHNQHNN